MAIAQPRSGQRVRGRAGILQNFGINARRAAGLLRVNDGDECKRGNGACQGGNAIPFRHAALVSPTFYAESKQSGGADAKLRERSPSMERY
jgi:hypothetical protein